MTLGKFPVMLFLQLLDLVRMSAYLLIFVIDDEAAVVGKAFPQLPSRCQP